MPLIPGLQLRWGMCSESWMGFTLTVAQIQTVLFATMFLQSLRKFARPNSEPALWCCCKNSDSYLVDEDRNSNKPVVVLPTGKAPAL